MQLEHRNHAVRFIIVDKPSSELTLVLEELKYHFGTEVDLEQMDQILELGSRTIEMTMMMEPSKTELVYRISYTNTYNIKHWEVEVEYTRLGDVISSEAHQ